jgi:hypothetical protein
MLGSKNSMYNTIRLIIILWLLPPEFIKTIINAEYSYNKKG